jgi:hypothetical protein
MTRGKTMAAIHEHAAKLRAVVSALLADGYRLEDGSGATILYMDVAIVPERHDSYVSVMSDGKPFNPIDPAAN